VLFLNLTYYITLELSFDLVESVRQYTVIIAKTATKFWRKITQYGG
jgi:hypothetical protein